MGKIIGKEDDLELNKSDVYVIDESMNIIYLKGVKNGDKTYWSEKENEINNTIEKILKNENS